MRDLFDDYLDNLSSSGRTVVHPADPITNTAGMRSRLAFELAAEAQRQERLAEERHAQQFGGFGAGNGKPVPTQLQTFDGDDIVTFDGDKMYSF